MTGSLIIDHGGGWMSLIVNVGSPLKPGDKVAARRSARPGARSA